VGDGEQALEAIGTFGPDIVLADIDMPKLNGYQLCEKIKNNPATVHIPLILLAGAFEPFDEEFARSVGADDNIIKPFESQELISKVKSLLVGVEPGGGGMSVATGVQEVSQVALEEGPQLDQEIKFELEEKDEFKVTADEEFVVEPAPVASNKGFEDELSDAMLVEAPSVSGVSGIADNLEMPSKERIEDMIRQSVESKVSEVFSGDSMIAMIDAIKEVASENLAQNAPRIIEDVTRQLATDIMQSLHGEISAAIGKIVPEVAETIIKKEIEKITARS
ncbi:MAG: response regulator, partial [Nitrospirae bacterium]|nr:response regulator [Nitrospirota bacterium]